MMTEKQHDITAAWQAASSGIKAGDIRFAATPCRLGVMLLAASGKGVCYLAFADDEEFLRDDLRRNFPKEILSAGDERLRGLAEQLAQWLGESVPALPLDLRGTAFQQRVWQALREVPAGSMASYAEIARRIGAPTAVRAVASACAANLVAILVPCHRIAGSDGRPCGYHWGIWRKQALLDWEGGSGS